MRSAKGGPHEDGGGWSMYTSGETPAHVGKKRYKSSPHPQLDHNRCPHAFVLHH